MSFAALRVTKNWLYHPYNKKVKIVSSKIYHRLKQNIYSVVASVGEMFEMHEVVKREEKVTRGDEE